MIRAHDRVASVLARAPELVDVFANASPAFEKLRNPILRKTMARLVTVEQAARIAGIETQALLEKLNHAIGEAAPPDEPLASSLPTEPSQAPAGLFDTPASDIVDLDVREDLRQGREPFSTILKTVRELGAAKVFRLRAIFEPVPLYNVLAKQGFLHFTERLADDDWRVWFYRSENARASARIPLEPIVSLPEGDIVILDVRFLEPPEPMVRTLEALADLPRGKTLLQINRRVPQFLLPQLEGRGFVYEIREQSEDLVRVFIRHR